MSSTDEQHDEVTGEGESKLGDLWIDMDEWERQDKKARRDFMWSHINKFEKLIEDLTGRKDDRRLAEIMVRTLIQNQGRGGSGSLPYELRCACGEQPFNEKGEWRFSSPG